MKRFLKIGAFIAALVHWVFLAPKHSPSHTQGSPERHLRTPATTEYRKRLLLELALLIALLATGGFLVVVSGVVSIKASSGHWPITRWFLDFAKLRSVSTYALLVEAPTLEEPGLVLKGAGHYEIGCRPCHGSPELRAPKIPSRMTPHPPYLPETISRWNRPELFHIVKHGIKFTGMPAWPAPQRDDEVWAIVAFLLKFSNMNEQEYRHLTRGELAEQATASMESLSGREEIPSGVFESCGRCHGLGGRSRGPGSIPILAGQSSLYMENALRAYAQGQRHSGIMEPIAAALSAGSIQNLARYYSGHNGLGSSSERDASVPDIRRGEAIARDGIPSQRVPACADCHGPGTTLRNPAYPILVGQYMEYLVLQLTVFKEQRRGGSPYAHIMQEVAPRLTMQQIREVATYYQWLGTGADHPLAGGSFR